MWHLPVRCRSVLQVVARCVPEHTQHAPSPIVVFVCGGIRHIPYAAAYVGCICGSTIGIVQPSISPIRHVTYGTTYATRGIVPQTTTIHSQPAHSACENTHATTTHRPPRPDITTSGNARMRQHTRDGNPPSSTPGHHDIRRHTYATTYTVCRFANSRVQASQRPASSVFRHMHHLNNRRRCVSPSSHDAG